jgi:hypothetical protein
MAGICKKHDAVNMAVSYWAIMVVFMWCEWRLLVGIRKTRRPILQGGRFVTSKTSSSPEAHEIELLRA